MLGSTRPSLSQAVKAPHPEEGAAKEKAIQVEVKPKTHYI
jgi:hypothetical protein